MYAVLKEMGSDTTLSILKERLAVSETKQQNVEIKSAEGVVGQGRRGGNLRGGDSFKET